VSRLVIWATPRLDVARLLLHDLVAADVDLHVVAGDHPPGETTIDLAGRRAVLEGADWGVTPMRAGRIALIGRVVQLVHALSGRSRAEVERRERATAIERVVERRCLELRPDAVVAVGAELARALRTTRPLLVVAATEEVADGRRGGLLASALSAIERVTAARRAARSMARADAVVDPAGSAGLMAELARLPARADPGPAPWAGPRPPDRASIVVATRDRGDLLRESLPSVLAAAAAAPGTEVIVVQQGTAVALAPSPGLVVVHDQGGRGASRARNIGTERSSGDVVLFTDDDCVVPPRWVLDHLAAVRDPRVVASCGQVTGLTRGSVSGDPAAHALLHRAGAMPWHVGHGSNLAVRSEALRGCGAWDERLGPGTALPAGEDADLLVRLLERGGAVRSGVGAPVVHLAWRSDDDDAANLIAYERGAGYWIGKALRERRSMARLYVRGRLRLHRQGQTAGARAAFAVGVIRGLRLAPLGQGE